MKYSNLIYAPTDYFNPRKKIVDANMLNHIRYLNNYLILIKYIDLHESPGQTIIVKNLFLRVTYGVYFYGISQTVFIFRQ